MQEYLNAHPAILAHLTLAFVRSGGHPRLPGGSDGELGSHHLQRDQPAGGEELVPPGETSGGLCCSARACPPGVCFIFFSKQTAIFFVFNPFFNEAQT